MLEKIIFHLKNIIDTKLATVLILVVVIFARALHVTYFYNIVVDAAYQVIGAQSLLNGHGVSLPSVLPSNLSETIYTPLINWPPTYSFIFAPFYYLFNYNYLAAGITLDIIGSIAFIFACRSILKLLTIPLYLRNVFTLLTSFFIYHFYFNACSDAIAITFFLWALYFILKIIKTDSSIKKNYAAATIFLFLCGSMKYLFFPIVFVLPALLFLYGVQIKKRIVIYGAIISLSILIISLGGILIYQKSISGSAAYISAPGRGFYPENLKKVYPLIPAGFIKPETIAITLGNLTTIDSIYYYYRIIYCVSIICLIILFIRDFKKKKFKDIEVWRFFLYAAFFTSLAIIILLSTLSIFVEKEQIFSWLQWTYIEEARYHGLPHILLHLSVFIFYLFYQKDRKNFYKKYMFCILLILMVPEMLRGIYFTSMRVVNLQKEQYSWQIEKRFQDYSDSLISIEKNNFHHENKVVVASTSYNWLNRVVINSRLSPLTDPSSINNISTLRTQKPLVLLVMMDNDSIANYQGFLNHSQVVLKGELLNFKFYTTIIEANKNEQLK